jgi:hypothetical protein
MRISFASAEDSTVRKTTSSSCVRGSSQQFATALAFFGTLTGCTYALKHLELAPAVRMLLPVLPLVTGLLYVLSVIRDLRRQVDELQLRLYLEASAVVVCGLFVLMLVFPVLKQAGIIETLDETIVMLLIVGLGIGGYLNARRRYR